MTFKILVYLSYVECPVDYVTWTSGYTDVIAQCLGLEQYKVVELYNNTHVMYYH